MVNSALQFLNFEDLDGYLIGKKRKKDNFFLNFFLLSVCSFTAYEKKEEKEEI